MSQPLANDPFDNQWPPPLAGASAPPAPASVRPHAGVGVFDNTGLIARVGAAPVSSVGKRLVAYFLEALLIVVTFFVGWLIWSLVTWSKGQTPAKALLGMRCVNADTGRSAGWGKMAVRELLGKSLLGGITFGITTLISCFMIFGSTRQCVWDRVASTIVVDDPDGRLLQ